MNKIILALAFTFSTTAMAAISKPLCRGNKKLAKEAMLSKASARFGAGCKVKNLKKNMDWPSEGREGYGALLNCPAKPQRNISASVVKENNVCTISAVRISPLTGAQCGLTDTWGGEEDGPQWKFDESLQIALQDLTKTSVKALSLITQQQILAAAKAQDDTESVDSVELALDFLQQGSEAGEGYVHSFEFNGVNYESVETYPGGNSYGLIFLSGSAVPVANNGDGDIACRE